MCVDCLQQSVIVPSQCSWPSQVPSLTTDPSAIALTLANPCLHSTRWLFEKPAGSCDHNTNKQKHKHNAITEGGKTHVCAEHSTSQII